MSRFATGGAGGAAAAAPEASLLSLPALPAEVLAIVAEHIVRGGEAYWLAATSRTMRIAVADACRTLKVEVSTSRIRHAFSSLSRLRGTLALPGARAVAHANVDAPGAEHRARSLDRRYTWSPAGERALVAGATIDVLHYAWAHWWCWEGGYLPEPADARPLAAEYGRTDLLDVVFDADGSNTRTCMSVVCRHGATCGTLYRRVVEECVLVPMLIGASRATAEWFYSRMERLSSGDAWRGNYASAENLQRLAVAAAHGKRPYAALDLLLHWLYPRIGSRAPSDRPLGAQCVASVVLASLLDAWPESRRVTSRFVAHGPVHVELWAWLSRAVPTLVGLVDSFRDGSGLWVPKACTYRVVVRLLFNCRSSETYRWWQAHADAPFLDGVWQLAADGPLLGASALVALVGRSVVDGRWTPRLAFAYLTMRLRLESMATASSTQEAMERWHDGRSLFVESLVDLLLEDTDDTDDAPVDGAPPHSIEPPRTVVARALWVNRCSPHAFMEALRRFSQHVGDCARRTTTFARLLPGVLDALFRDVDGAHPALEPPELEHIEGISALRALYIEKQREGWNELGDDGIEQVVQLL